MSGASRWLDASATGRPTCSTEPNSPSAATSDNSLRVLRIAFLLLLEMTRFGLPRAPVGLLKARRAAILVNDDGRALTGADTRLPPSRRVRLLGRRCVSSVRKVRRPVAVRIGAARRNATPRFGRARRSLQGGRGR